MKVYRNLFSKIIQPETLFEAWREFRNGKGAKSDVLLFEKELEQNIFKLARSLRTNTYAHSGYVGFFISDPKRRHIHKATVRDRVLHHAIMTAINPVFEPTFIASSFSCRIGKGTHKGVEALRSMLLKESRNNTVPCYVLKCDIRKFFDSVDHTILLSIISKRIKDPETISLFENIIESYISDRSDLFHRSGVPIGNLTSQLFANIYMNEFDQFIKHTLKVKHYARYTDDFVIVSKNKEYLVGLIAPINAFLEERLGLDLHPGKVEIRSYAQGIDFLGYVLFPHHTLLRKRTKKRIFRRFEEKIECFRKKEITKEGVEASFRSYLGVLSHADAFILSTNLKNYFWFMTNE